MIDIVPGEEHRAAVLELFSEYFGTLVDAGLATVLANQNPQAELDDLGAVYERVYLALDDGAPVGCVAFKRLGDDAELKRLYVRPAGRGKGVGTLLLDAAITDARALGFPRLLLDTSAHMTTAIAMYERHGFARIEAYNDNPDPGAVFMSLRL